MALDRQSVKPLHQQMEELIRANLASGEWKAGQMIPSENELGREYGLSRMTVRNVVTKLVQERLLVRIAGKGTFVAEPPIIAKALSYAGIREQLEEMGYEVDTRLLSVGQEIMGEKTAAILGIDPQAPCWVIRRLRSVKGTPLSLHTSCIPVSLCPDLDDKELEKEQLCAILSDHYRLSRHKTIETLESVAANFQEAKWLDVRAGHPLLLLKDYVYDETGKVFEFTKVVFRGEKIKLHLEF